MFQQFPCRMGQTGRTDPNALERKCAHRLIESHMGMAAAEQRN